ncbi:histidine phosphatase family protein [Thermosulfuriphilus sp.]
MKTTRLILIRHGELESPKPKVFHSQNDVPLSDKGRIKMETIVRGLAGLPICCVASSDLSRTTYGANLLAHTGGIPHLVDCGFREINFGTWSGLSWEEIEKGWPGELEKRFQDPLNHRPPGGESLLELRDRVMKALEELLATYPGELLALFAHGGVNRVILAEALGLPLKNIFRLQQDYGCLNLIDYIEDGLCLVRVVNAPYKTSVKDLLYRNDWP